MENNKKNNIFNGIFLGDSDSSEHNSLVEDITENNHVESSEELEPSITPEEGVADDSSHEVDDSQEEPDAEDIDYDVKLKGNPITIIAKDWQEKGRIPSDFEIKDDLTPEEFEEVYRGYLQKSTEAELRTEAIKALKEEYRLDESFLEQRKLMSLGVNPDLVNAMDSYYRLASIELDPNDTKYETYAKDLFKYYYADKEFSDEEIEEFAERDIESGDVVKKVEKVQLYFSKKGSEKRNEIQQKEAETRSKIKEKQDDFANRVRTKLASMQINNKQYTKEQMAIVSKAFFDKTEVIVNPDGSRERVTLFEKKTREHKTDFDLYMDHVVNFILGQNAKATDISAGAQNRNILKDLNKIVEITKKDIVKKPTTFQTKDIVGEEIN